MDADASALHPAEPPQQHIRNVQQILAGAYVDEHGVSELTAGDRARIQARLARVLAQLETADRADVWLGRIV